MLKERKKQTKKNTDVTLCVKECEKLWKMERMYKRFLPNDKQIFPSVFFVAQNDVQKSASSINQKEGIIP